MTRLLAALLSMMALAAPATALASDTTDTGSELVMISATSITAESTTQTITSEVINRNDEAVTVEVTAPVPPAATVVESSGDGDYDVVANEWQMTIAPRAMARRTFIVMV